MKASATLTTVAAANSVHALCVWVWVFMCGVGVVTVQWHKKYKIWLRRTNKFHAHDERKRAAARVRLCLAVARCDSL
jgi:hypothetical protein